MILGILSDSHGHPDRVARAIATLEEHGAGVLIHCGDLGGEEVLDRLAGKNAWFVWGNTDRPAAELIRCARALGLSPPSEVPLRLQLAGRRIAVFHGHEAGFSAIRRLAAAGDAAGLERAAAAEYVLYGHTHEAGDFRLGTVRLINPGALHRAAEKTVATLDLSTDRLEYWTVPAE